MRQTQAHDNYACGCGGGGGDAAVFWHPTPHQIRVPGYVWMPVLFLT